nr:putative inorganic phosphate cotransporter [Parasteatoda tepidariorum]
MFITFTKCRKALSSLIMMIGIGSTSLAASALINLPLDMSPDFAGLLTGIMHTVGALTGSFLPLLMGYLEESDEGIKYWNKVFNALTLLSIVALVLFLAFGSCEIQHWDSNCTIHPYQVKNLRAEMVVPLIYKKSGDSEKIIIPESKRKDLLGTKTVDKSKLADILQSQSMRRTTESKPLKDYSSDDDTLI